MGLMPLLRGAFRLPCPRRDPDANTRDRAVRDEPAQFSGAIQGRFHNAPPRLLGGKGRQNLPASIKLLCAGEYLYSILKCWNIQRSLDLCAALWLASLRLLWYIYHYHHHHRAGSLCQFEPEPK